MVSLVGLQKVNLYRTQDWTSIQVVQSLVWKTHNATAREYLLNINDIEKSWKWSKGCLLLSGTSWHQTSGLTRQRPSSSVGLGGWGWEAKGWNVVGGVTKISVTFPCIISLMERVGRSEDFTRVAIAREGLLDSADRRVREGGGGLVGGRGASQVNVTQTETRKLGRSLEFFMSS